MKNVFVKVAVLLASSLLVIACSQPGGGVAVIDLSVIAADTGQDEVIRVRAEEARDELAQQLQQVAMALDEQLLAERSSFGEIPTQEQELQMQQMNAQARQQLMEAQSQAQQQVSQIEQGLIDEFRAEVLPLAQEIARAKGANIVVAKDAYLVWYDDSIEITAAVVAAWEALPPEEVAEVAAELEQAEEEMVEAAQEFVEAEEQVEELQEELQEELKEELEEAEVPVAE